tara:strand:- start:1121 stop:1885 length:765 start_codon:yes stop_codon:yes gene_type:complete
MIRRTKTTNIDGREIFFNLLNDNKAFKMLKGYSDMYLSMNSDGQYIEKRIRYKQRTQPSFFWRYEDRETNAGAILEVPENKRISCRVILKCLWVPEEHSRKGIAKRCLENVLAMVDEVNELCKSGDKYNDLNINCSCFSTSLVPNPFWTDVWTLDQRKNKLDWSNAAAATKCLEDESYNELPIDKRRATWKELREFYFRLGFVEAEGLSHQQEWDKSTNRIRNHTTMLPRSYCIGRMNLIYPAENLDYFTEEEE